MGGIVRADTILLVDQKAQASLPTHSEAYYHAEKTILVGSDQKSGSADHSTRCDNPARSGHVERDASADDAMARLI
jgi:hypothetical protein